MVSANHSHNPTPFVAWLSITQELQRERYKSDLVSLEGPAYAASLRQNGFAAIVELGEYAQKRDWKPYKTEGRNEETREDAIEELVDVLHHIANLLVLERVTDEELSAAYMKKVEKNRVRPDHHS